MIIELFGPPSAGKTTFGHTLVAQLRRRGHAAKFFASYRPSERLSYPESRVEAHTRNATAAAARRLAGPLAEMLTLLRHPLGNSRDIKMATNLIKILPPRNIIWSIRMTQYISRFTHSWYQACAADHMVLFDQAYVQAVCSLAILSDIADEAVLRRALDIIPKPELLIHLSAPRDVLKTRLCERRNKQGAIERLFEFDLKRNLQSIELTDRLHDMLLRSGRDVACAYSIDRRSLHESGENIARRLCEKRPART